MEIFLNRIDGVDDAITTMYLSKRHLTREKELEIRREVAANSRLLPPGPDDDDTPIGAIVSMTPALREYMGLLLRIGLEHITLLRFVDLSFSVYGMHRGGQDDLDAHAYRMNNRIVRASTRLGTFGTGEMSEFYQGSVIPTDVALAHLGIVTPDRLVYDGKAYVRAANGYILEGHEENNDYKRGLYMMSIPSDFVFRINLAEYAHLYKMRNESTRANPEVKRAIENATDQLEAATMGLVTRQLLAAVPN